MLETATLGWNVVGVFVLAVAAIEARSGINADTAAVPDGEVFTQCLLEGFEEVLALAGTHDPARRSWPYGARRSTGQQI